MASRNQGHRRMGSRGPGAYGNNAGSAGTASNTGSGVNSVNGGAGNSVYGGSGSANSLGTASYASANSSASSGSFGTPESGEWYNSLSSINSKESSAAKHMDDRLLYGLVSSIGCRAVITMRAGGKVSGILYSVGELGDSGTFSVCLKYPVDESRTKSFRSDYLVVHHQDIAMVDFEEVDFTPRSNSSNSVSSGSNAGKQDGVGSPASSAAEHGFRTDTDISAVHPFKEHELQRWVDDDDGVALEDLNTPSTKSNGKWDQFKTNETKFGIHSTYDELLYTTKVSRDGPDFEKRFKEAQRIANEIEGQGSHGNVHIAEDRGVIFDDSGMDEEDKYSGVTREPKETKEASKEAKDSKDSKDFNPGDQILMGMLKSGSSHGHQQNAVCPVAPGRYATPRQRAAFYHQDPAVIYSSAVAKLPSKPTKKSSESPPAAGASSPTPPKMAASKSNTAAATASTASASSTHHPDIKALKDFSEHLKLPSEVPQDIMPIISRAREEREKCEEKKHDEEKKEEEKPKVQEEEKKEEPPKKQESATPSSTAPSSSSSHFAHPTTRKRTPVSFFGPDRVPVEGIDNSKLAIFDGTFSILVSARAEYEKNHDGKPLEEAIIVNLEKPFTTPPTWPATTDKSYKELFPRQQEWLPPPMGRKMFVPSPPVGMMAPQGLPPPMMMPGPGPGMQQMSPQQSPQFAPPFLAGRPGTNVSRRGSSTGPRPAVQPVVSGGVQPPPNSAVQPQMLQPQMAPQPMPSPQPQPGAPLQQMRMQAPPGSQAPMMGAMPQYGFMYQQAQFVPMYQPGPMPVNGAMPYYASAGAMPQMMMPGSNGSGGGGGQRRNSRNHGNMHYNNRQ